MEKIQKNSRLYFKILVLGVSLLGIGYGVLRSRRSLQVERVSLTPDDSTKSASFNQARDTKVREDGQEQAPVLNHKDAEKFKIFLEILKSGNDQDPRLDRELKGLSEPLKRELTKKYQEMDQEKFSARGLVAFLIGRELSSSADFQFAQSVLNEPVLVQDAHEVPAQNHHAAVDQITRVYPQMVTLEMIEAKWKEGGVWGEEIKKSFTPTLESLSQSRNLRIASRARELLQLFKSHR